MKKDEIEALKTEVTQLRLSEGAKAERLGQLEADQRHLNDKLSAAERSVLELSEAKSELQRQLQAQRDASDSSKDTVDKMQQVRVGVCGTVVGSLLLPRALVCSLFPPPTHRRVHGQEVVEIQERAAQQILAYCDRSAALATELEAGQVRANTHLVLHCGTRWLSVTTSLSVSCLRCHFSGRSRAFRRWRSGTVGRTAV